MKIKVQTFGSLTDLMEKEFCVEAADTESLLTSLRSKQAALNSRKFLLAVNNVIVKENTILKENDEVALLPPYSGG